MNHRRVPRRRVARGQGIRALELFCSLGICAVSALGEPGGAFEDVTQQAGIDWSHFNGESPDRHLIEVTTGGLGFLDYDNDGLLDLFLVNGGETPRGKSARPVQHALYRNMGNGRFREVAQEAGVARTRFYGMGVAAADYDNDGDQDIYLTGYPESALFRNDSGVFAEVTDLAGVRNEGRWGAGAAWFDYDRDGLLDLFVCNYAELSFARPKRCAYAGEPTYCEQKIYPGQVSALFRNRGEGSFEDATAEAGIDGLAGRALGVVAVDINNDGWTDLYVARDGSPDQLLLNKRNGTFDDVGLEAEISYDPDGEALAGMGVDAGDVDGDGWPDLAVTNFHDEYHTLWRHSGGFPFENLTHSSGLARHTRTYVGWGVRMLDFDNDSDLDLMIVNGHVNRMIELTRSDVTYREPPLLLANDGRGAFKNISSEAGPVFQEGHLARGLAAGDFDNDGDEDVAFIRLGERPVLLRNRVGQEAGWIGLRLSGTISNRDAIGARIVLRTSRGQQLRWILGGGGFLASHDRRIVFGLGPGEPPGSLTIEVRWPSGSLERFEGLAPNRYHRLTESAPAHAPAEP